MVRTALAVAAKDLRQRQRDHSTLITALLAPLALAVVMSVALGGFSNGVHAHLGIADESASAAGGQVIDTLRTPSLHRAFSLTVIRTQAGAREAVARGKVDAAIIIPRAFFADLGDREPLRTIDRADRPVGAAVARAIADDLTARVATARLAIAATAASGTQLSVEQATALAQEAAKAPAGVVDRSPGPRVPPATYYAPAMGILFLFFLTGFGARSFLVERREGTLGRVLAAPVRPAALLAGKALAVLALGLASMMILYGTTVLLFGARWGSTSAVLALTAAIVVAVIAITALVTTLAKTDNQANTYASALAFVLALVGGNFIAVYHLPPVLQVVSALTPNGWALRGYADVAAGAGLGAAALPVAAIAAFALVCGAAAVKRSGRLLMP